MIIHDNCYRDTVYSPLVGIFNKNARSMDTVLVKFGPIWDSSFPIADAIIEQLAECGYNVQDADTDTLELNTNRELINTYNITEVPTYILFKNGEEVKRFDKNTTFSELKEVLECL